MKAEDRAEVAWHEGGREAITAAIKPAEAEAYRRGQEAMRERAALVARDTEHVVDHPHSYEPYYDTDATLSNTAKAIRKLPIEEEEVAAK